jgi:RNA polymerase sigma-54 factor
MRLDTSQQLRLSQEMKLAPRLIQAMEILQLPMMALQERIEAEMESNPVLDVAESTTEDSDGDRQPDREWGQSDMVVDEDHGNREDFSRLDDMTAEYGSDFATEDAPLPSHVADPEAGNRKLEAMANTPAAQQTLTEYLREQWVFADAEPRIDAAGERIIENIDEDGYLRIPLEELATREEPHLPLPDLQAALQRVQQLDPTGVGARDLRECLLLQLDAQAQTGRDVSLEKQLVGSFLREIELNRLPQIARRTSRSIEEIKDALASIGRLTPRPGLLVGQDTAPVVSPDVVVMLDDDGNVVVVMADDHVPALAVNEYYQDKARDRATDKATKDFLRRNLRSAQWLMEAIAQRRRTIRRVTEEVFKVQREFLDHGPEALKPLPMADVAEKVGVHVATVSRAVADKYVQTPRGIFPLRMFFSGGTKTAGGEDMSWDAVKFKLQEIVDAEDKSKPLNDDQLAEKLRADGIDIARRTVAKYRNLLNIPPARKRREY